MKHNIPHDLSPELARTATERAFAAYTAKFPDYSPTSRWVNEHRAEISFSAKGLKLSGAIELQPKNIELELDVPFLLKPFSKKAVSIIETEIQEWIAKAKNGELG